MKKQDVLKKLNRRIARLKAKSATPDKINFYSVLGLQYRVRTNTFSNAKGSCGLDLETMEGHSYQWYDLVKRIKGTVYLNTYRYSQQTSQHIWQSRSVLEFFGIKYRELEAPKGLQNLEWALSYAIEERAKNIVVSRYARVGKNWSRSNILYFEKQIETLKTLGFKATKKMLDAAIERAESERLEKNAHAREKSKVYREAKKIKDAETLALKTAQLEALKKNKYAYRKIWGRNAYKFILVETSILAIDSDYLMSLSPVAGETKKNILNYLRVMARLDKAV